MQAIVLLGFKAVYVFCICYAIISDFRNLLIPNWIPVTLTACFALFAAISLTGAAVLTHIWVALLIFALMLAFFILRWVAGGDVKLLTAVALWVGPEHAAPLVVLMAFFGSALALSLIGLRKYGFLIQEHVPANWFLTRMTTLADEGQCPYGVAIGTAAMLTLGSTFPS
jgi:prepilin peptidase CpaA